MMFGPVAARADESPVDFFERRIRPVLVARCYECHSAEADEIGAGLRLDHQQGMLQGGDSGAAIVRGRPDDSLLIRALRYQGPEMPPDGKLAEAVVADFVRWIELGAPDPRSVEAPRADVPGRDQAGGAPNARSTAQAAPLEHTDVATLAGKIDFEAARRHWSYRPIQRPELPAPSDKRWSHSPIDRLVYARLEAARIVPSPAADRRTLVRRLYIDLIGLPPTYDQVEWFVRDDSADAYAKLVDELLASPHYGERWARHWLDVARYADTKDGVLMYGADRIRPYAYTFRDYCIRAFNEDLPFDEMVRDSLAADQRQPPVEPWRLAAMGFLTLGKMFDNNPPDVYDDRIDVVTRGLLGLTVACARCHDHKYDAITQADYYALYGVFASSEAPLDLPLACEAADAEAAAEFEAEAVPLRKRLADLIATEHEKQTETARRRVADYLERIVTRPPDPLETAVFFTSLSPDDLRPAIVARWRRYLAERTVADDPVFGAWHDLLAIAPAELSDRAPQIVAAWLSRPKGTGPGQLNPLVARALSGAELREPRDVAQLYGTLLLGAYNDFQSRENDDQRHTATARQQLLDLLVGRGSPVWFPRSHAYMYMARTDRGQYHNLQGQLDKLAVTKPGAPPRAMILVDAPELHDPRIFVRGNAMQPAASVPRRFLQVVAGQSPTPFAHGSGRIDLAEAIIARDNPLTARVLANRIWMHHFGEPLVSTPSDFGARSTAPVQRELLDWLAAELLSPSDPSSRPWSIKHLHRQIVSSEAYRQASFDRGEARRADPDNRLLWRYERRRLDFETMRDAMLAVSNQLDRTLLGRPVNIAADPSQRRRTIYGLVDRQDLPSMFRVFDFATPDQTIERRPMTTTPQQALFAMNSPFVAEQARAAAQGDDVRGACSRDERIVALYRRILARDPTFDEAAAALRFVDDATPPEQAGESIALDAWGQLAQVLLASNEFMFVD